MSNMQGKFNNVIVNNMHERHDLGGMSGWYGNLRDILQGLQKFDPKIDTEKALNYNKKKKVIELEFEKNDHKYKLVIKFGNENWFDGGWGVAELQRRRMLNWHKLVDIENNDFDAEIFMLEQLANGGFYLIQGLNGVDDYNLYIQAKCASIGYMVLNGFDDKVHIKPPKAAGTVGRYPKDYIAFVKNYELNEDVQNKQDYIMDGKVVIKNSRFILYNGGRTIAYGHDVKDGEDFSNGLSLEEGENLLIKDLEKEGYDRVKERIHSLNVDCSYNIDIEQFNTNELMFFVDFAFNRGVGLVVRPQIPGKPRFSLSILIAAVCDNDDAKIRQTLLEETKDLNGNYLKGLELRRMDEYEILKSNEYIRSYDINRFKL